MIYIIRHGQTELNNKKALQGRSDHPLNDTGIQQAQEAAENVYHQAVAEYHQRFV